jgi:hypothetical protein
VLSVIRLVTWSQNVMFHDIGAYLEQGISLDRKKFEMYLRPNGARSTKLLGEKDIYIGSHVMSVNGLRNSSCNIVCHHT